MRIDLVDPFPPCFQPLAWGWLEPVRHIVCDDYSPKSIGEFVEYSIRANARVIGITDDERIVGAVTFELASPTMAIMHVLFGPYESTRFRGVRKTGIAARLACGRLFSTTGTLKILGLIPEDNRLAIALAVRSGAQVEGVLRSHTTRGGEPVNAVAVGITKEDFGNGTEFRRIGRREQQHDHGIRNGNGELVGDIGGNTDVHGGAEQLAIDAEPGLFESLTSGILGRDLAQCPGSPDGGSGSDQQDGGSLGRQDEPVSRKPRVRAKRASGTKRVANGTGKTGGARGKRERGKRAAARTK